MAAVAIRSAAAGTAAPGRSSEGSKSLVKITEIKTFLPSMGSRNRALIKVETDEGVYGWGEAYSIGPDLSVKPIVDYMAPWFVGQDPRRIEYLMMKTLQQFRFPPGGT